LPDWVDTRQPDISEYADYLIDTTLRAHGFATQKSMTYLRKGRSLRVAINAQLEARFDAKLLTTLKIANGDQVYINPEVLETRAPRSQARVRILSPFDNAVIQRQRGRDIFDFDYQIECYVPEAKRRYGYFCLPVLYRDGFVGRIDCKAHRSTGTFEIKALHLEGRVDEGFAEAFNQALLCFVDFNACSETRLSCANAEDLLSRV
jgi:hypothetical protein